MTTYLEITKEGKCVFLSYDDRINGSTTKFWNNTCIGYEKEQIIYLAKIYYDEAIRGKGVEISVSGEYKEDFLEEVKKPPMQPFIVTKRKVKESDHRVYAYNPKGALEQAKNGYSAEISSWDRHVRTLDVSEWDVRAE